MGRGPERQPYHDELLYRLLQEGLGDVGEPAIAALWPHLEWAEIAGGETLIQQGDPGDALYLLVSGRLRASVRTEAEGPRVVGEITRGQIVGEMSLFTGEPRTATVTAIRDSLLVRLPKAAFDTLLAQHAPLSRALARQVIQRLQTAPSRTLYPRPTTIALLPASKGVDLAAIARGLAAALTRFGRTEVIDSASVQGALESPEGTLGPQAMVDVHRRITLLLDRIEARNEFVLLLADPESTAWTARCCRDADELLLLADATQPPVLHPVERLCLMNRTASTDAAELLVLLHGAEVRAPQGTAAWLDRRPVAGHLHLRPALVADFDRLARFLNRSATGLVLAGGGARGLAHLGVLRALQEHGVAIDAVAGTSIGAVMAVYVASDRPLPEVMANARTAMASNPTGDFSSMPWLSVFRGRRLRRTFEQAVLSLLGHDADLEDLWRPTSVMASNYSQAREQLLSRGRVVKTLLASTAIPGALPPVLHQGELLCDGGSFNNFPVDVMRAQRGVATVIGIDLDFRQPLQVELEEVPGGWALLRDQLRPARQRRYRLPGLPTYLMTVMMLSAIARGRRVRGGVDLLFNPPLEGVGLLQWKRFDRIVQQGYEHASAVLAQRRQPPV